MTWEVRVGDVLEVLKGLDDDTIQCVVCSPPYWGLRAYGGEPGMIGLEPTLEGHVKAIVAVFREIRRVLRPDGTVWLNYGDAYAGSGKGGNPHAGSTLQGSLAHQEECKRAGRARKDAAETAANVARAKAKGYDVGAWGASDGAAEGFDRCHGDSGLSPKQRMLLPHRIALALQADGWWVRSEIVWAKPNPMPSSVTDRPADAHEFVFLLTKRPRYFYDSERVKEPYAAVTLSQRRYNGQATKEYAGTGAQDPSKTKRSIIKGIDESRGRNLRTVWTIPTQPYREAHFATYPERLVEPCLKAGTSAKGACGECGAPWRRTFERDFSECETEIVDREVRGPVDEKAVASYLRERRKAKGLTQRQVDEAMGTSTLYSWFEGRPAGFQAPTPERWLQLKEILELDDRFDEQINSTETIQVEVTVQPEGEEDERVARPGRARHSTFKPSGWERTCDHEDAPTLPCVVLDPFNGSGTTGVVAVRLGCDYVGIEINEEYAQLARKRIGRAAAEVGQGGDVPMDEDPKRAQLGLFAQTG